MRQFFNRLPPLAVTFLFLQVTLILPPPTLGSAVNNVATTEVSQLALTKFFRNTYSSEKLLQHGIQSIFRVPNLSRSCSRDMTRFVAQVEAIINLPKGENETTIENWALQMLDAWAKVPEGILSGHVNALGDFDECLAVRAPASKPNLKPFQGKYCLAYVVPNLPTRSNKREKINSQSSSDPRTVENLMRILSITGAAELPIIPSMGSCLPSTCSDQEILQVLKALLANVSLTPVTSFCHIDEPVKLGAGAVATISVLGVLVMFAMVGTAADLAIKYDYLPLSFSKSTFFRILLAFSIASNGQKLLNTETGSGDIGCLHGLRFLSASWVVLGHTYLLGIMQPLWNMVETFNMMTSSVVILVILNASIVVDIFFVIGGFLVSLSVLSMIKNANGRINIPMLYIHRYLRITPLYMLIVCMGTFIFPILGNGPFWHVAETWAGFCEKNWWKNMLYINNLPIYDTLNDPQDAPCHGIAWYLGVDMQLFLLSPFLLYPVWRWKKWGQIPLVLLTLGAAIVPGLITYLKDYLPTSVPFQSAAEKYSQEAYTPTYMRAGPYLIGMCTGLLYNSIRNKAFKLKKPFVIIAWLLAFVVGFTVLLSPHKFYDPVYNFQPGESGIYVSGHRTAWALSVAWLIFACATGYGGWINQVLSWRPFVPLGRLTFAIYLVSMHMQFLFHLQSRVPIYFGHYHLINLYFSHIVMSCIVALMCTLVIEAPLMQLLKMMFPTRSPKRRNNDSISNNNNNNDITSIRTERRCSVSPAPSGESHVGSSRYGATSILATSQDKLV